MITLLSPLTISAADGSKLRIEANPQSWGGNIGLLTNDILAASTVVQLDLDEARRLAAALTEAARLLEELGVD